jgi:hypothetical protein
LDIFAKKKMDIAFVSAVSRFVSGFSRGRELVG